jgi:hypothetical protein
MKLIYLLWAFGLVSNCSSTRLIDSWRRYDDPSYFPKKTLIVGITDNLMARKLFEQDLKNELLARGIDAEESYNVFEKKFIDTKQTEAEIALEIDRLISIGYDSVLISAVKGVDDHSYRVRDQLVSSYYWYRFGPYYHLHQNAYYEPDYYNSYEVYEIEVSLYSISMPHEKSLVWVASYHIIDPKTIQATVTDYVKAIVRTLEKESLINKN